MRAIAKRHACRARVRPSIESLERRELLSSTVLEGLSARDQTGSVVAPIGQNANINPATSLEMFAIGAPFADPGSRVDAGEVYVVVGSANLYKGATGRDQIQALLTRQDAVVIRGAGAGDLLGYAVAGSGDIIGPALSAPDGIPDLLVGAPKAKDSLGNVAGKVYLIGGDLIANVLNAARTAGGTTVATINLASPPAGANILTLTGPAGSEYGTSVAGLGMGAFAVGAPLYNQGRGLVDIYKGTVWSSRLEGPSLGAHLGGIPASELQNNGIRGYGVSGIRNPALVSPNASAQTNTLLFDAYDTPADADILVGAPDACFNPGTPSNYACTATSIRPGLAYLLSGSNLLNNIVAQTFNLGSQADLKTLNAIVVRGEQDGDRFGAVVSAVGDLNGDGQLVSGPYSAETSAFTSDFAFGAPDYDVPTITLPKRDAGAVYVVFGKEVTLGPIKAGNNNICTWQDTGAGRPPPNLFRQCQDNNGDVIPLDVTDFHDSDLPVGLILQGHAANDRFGSSIADARDYTGPIGRLTVVQPNLVQRSDLLVGSPFFDPTVPPVGTTLVDAGAAYVVPGSTTFQSIHGHLVGAGNISTLGGSRLDGQNPGEHYGVSVAGIGNVFDPPNEPGDDIAVGANRAPVTRSGTAVNLVGQVTIFFGITGAGGGPLPPGQLPFIQPGPFGPQMLVGGYWSFTNQAPPAGSFVQFPLDPSAVANVNINLPLSTCSGATCPPVRGVNISTGVLNGPLNPLGRYPTGATGPFAAALPGGAPVFITDRPNQKHKGAKRTRQTDDHGNSPSKATRLAFDRRGAAKLKGKLDGATDKDWFSFKVSRSGRVVIRLNSAAGVPVVKLRRAGQKRWLAVNRRGGKATKRMVIRVQAGRRYQILVKAPGNRRRAKAIGRQYTLRVRQLAGKRARRSAVDVVLAEYGTRAKRRARLAHAVAGDLT